MPSNFEEEVESYYKAKESYTELLHQCAVAEPTEDASTNGHSSEQKSSREEDPFSQNVSESLANIFSKLDIAAAMAKSKNANDEPHRKQPKGKSKGKK